jgi:dTMP kinase
VFIVFEGIDGSGKTTVSNRVAKALRKRGVSVEHVREGGEFAQPVLRRLREFGKDKRNFELTPLAEMLMYVARDAQLLEDAIRPALARGQVVFADRYLYSYEVLGCEGRGLPREMLRPILDAVAVDTWPDLVVLCNVDPHIARARRKVSKIDASALGKREESSGGSRKGLAGVGVNTRVAEGYRAIARREAARWIVVDNAFEALDAVVERVTEAVSAVVEGRPLPKLARAGADPPRATAATPQAARAAFYRFIETRAETEPATAAYFIGGLDDDPSWDWREQLVEAAPAVIAHGIRGLDDARAWRLREQLWRAAPYQVARSLAGEQLDNKRAHAMRARFVDDQPRAVLATIAGDASMETWELRRRLAEAFLEDVVRSVRGDDGREAWQLRERLLTLSNVFEDPILAASVAHSLRGLDTERAWQLRRQLFDASPTGVLGSLGDVRDDESWEWRARYVARAPKVVLRTFDGSEDERAWELRRATALRAKEAIDSMNGLDSDAAWQLREASIDAWPSTVLKTVVPLARTDRAVKLTRELLERYPSNISLLKHATRIAAVQAGGAALEVVV